MNLKQKLKKKTSSLYLPIKNDLMGKMGKYFGRNDEKSFSKRLIAKYSKIYRIYTFADVSIRMSLFF